MRNRTLADLTKAEAEVARLTAIIKANGIDPLTGKITKVEAAVEPPLSINLKSGKAVITRIH